jgi:hypothetical protein
VSLRKTRTACSHCQPTPPPSSSSSRLILCRLMIKRKWNMKNVCTYMSSLVHSYKVICMQILELFSLCDLPPLYLILLRLRERECVFFYFSRSCFPKKREESSNVTDEMASLVMTIHILAFSSSSIVTLVFFIIFQAGKF